MKKISQGVLISIEGIDGSGKSTLLTNIAQALQQKQLPVIVTKEPGGTQLGKHLRTLLQERTFTLCPLAEFLLFAADRAQHFQELIIPHLAQNNIVISDRMADSSLVYQGFGRGLDLTMLETINQWTMQSLKPDITFYITIPLPLAAARLAQRGKLTAFEQEEQDFVQRLVTGFETIFSQRTNVIRLDGTLQPTDLTNQAVQAIVDILEKKSGLHKQPVATITVEEQLL